MGDVRRGAGRGVGVLEDQYVAAAWGLRLNEGRLPVHGDHSKHRFIERECPRDVGDAEGEMREAVGGDGGRRRRHVRRGMKIVALTYGKWTWRVNRNCVRARRSRGATA